MVGFRVAPSFPAGRTTFYVPRKLVLELEVTVARSSTNAFSAGGREQPCNPAQVLPSCLVQCWIRADQIADHIPRRNVERAFWRGSHRQGHRALRTKTDALGGRLLPRPDSHGLREHVYGDRFVSSFEFPITAKTIKIFQMVPPPDSASRRNTVAAWSTPQVCKGIRLRSAAWFTRRGKSPRTKVCSSQNWTASCTLLL